MTVLEPAFCPVCGDDRVTVFIRSELHQDLVCPSCRGSEGLDSLSSNAPHLTTLAATLPGGPSSLPVGSSPRVAGIEVGSGVPAWTPTQPTESA
jgi:hypothetical protein